MSYEPIDCRLGFHQIRRSVMQLSYMDQHCKHLLKHLNVILEVTYAMAPKRTATYALGRGEGKRPDEGQRERLLEKAIWRRWRWNDDLALSKSSKNFVENRCTRIQTYQMPLQNNRADQYWGRIDLIGVSPTGTPVVFELKKEKAADTPLRIVVEGLAYAIAVRKAWNEGGLRQKWMDSVKMPLGIDETPLTLLTVPIIGIAPKEYWDKRFKKGQKGFVQPAAWKSFRDLCSALEIRGFPVSFLQFNANGKDEAGLPLITDVSELDCWG